MSDLEKFDIYKITNNPAQGYIFSVVEQPENDDEPIYRYYMITFGQNNIPTIKRLNNTIELLNSDLLTLEKIEPNDEEMLKFISVLAKISVPRQKQDEPTTFYSDLDESDIQLFKKRA